MMHRTAYAVAAIAAISGVANASFTYLATNGSTLIRVNPDTSVEMFELGDDIVGQAVMNDGTILAFSNTRGPNGYEVYELTDPTGTPTLSMIDDDRQDRLYTYVDVDGQLVGVTGSGMANIDADYNRDGGFDGLGFSGGVGGAAYDPASGTFYVLSGNDNLYTVDLDQADRTATLLGDTGVDVQHMGLEFAGGVLHAAIASTATNRFEVGTIDTTTGAFNALVTLDLADELSALGPVSLSVVPTPGAGMLAGVGLLMGFRRRRN